MIKLRVAVVHGGRSGEHEISLRSAKAVLDHIDRQRFEPVPVFIDKQGKWHPGHICPEPGGNPGIDVVFPVLHGTFGEDGTIQGLFEMAGLPYVGAGVFASSAAMDKEHFKRLCADRGLPICEYAVQPASALDPDAAIARLGLPVFVKPANLGSSVGIAKAHNREELAAALADAARYDTKVIIERSIAGQELECAVLGNHQPAAATPCEILPSKEFYDYEDKYLLDKARTLIPPNLTAQQIEEVRRLAVACYLAVECSGMGRVDFLVEKATGQIYINEINTIPGFTSISMFPKMWEHDGVGFTALISRLIDLALERHAQRQALRFEL
ncbi:MAG: D-alanine--D-alanine ligase [Acidobacteria bacterium]|nr:D-alanine--D-alanine ligase [Acidobacteriota bacterium]